MEFMDPKDVMKLLELAEGNYRPKQILDLRAAIDEETRAAELHAVSTGIIDEDRILRIVQMKLEMDGLYADWAAGRIS